MVEVCHLFNLGLATAFIQYYFCTQVVYPSSLACLKPIQNTTDMFETHWCFLLAPLISSQSEIIKFDPGFEAQKTDSSSGLLSIRHGDSIQSFELVRPDNTIRPSFNSTLCLHNYKKDKVNFSPCMDPIPWQMRWRQEHVDERLFYLVQGNYDDIYSAGYLSLTGLLVKRTKKIFESSFRS